MVTLLLDRQQLDISLSAFERGFARGVAPARSDLVRQGSARIPREAIRRLQLTDDPWTWVRGRRVSGVHVPRLAAIGEWRTAGGEELVCVRGRALPGIVIDVDPALAGYERILLSTRHGLALARALHVRPSEA